MGVIKEKSMNSSASTIWKKVLISLGIIILFLFLYSLMQENLLDLLSQIQRRNLSLIIITALILTILNITLKAHRWRMLVKKISQKDASFSFSFKSIVCGVAASSIIPGRMEVAKPVLLKSEYNIPFNESVPSLFIERVLDLLSVIIILLASLFFLPSLGKISFSIVTGSAVILTTCIVVLLYKPSIYRPLLKKIITVLPFPQAFKQKLLDFSHKSIENLSLFKKEDLSAFLIISVIANSIEVLRFYSIASLIGLPLPLAVVGFAFTGSTILGIISAIPGGIGITEFSAAAIIEQLSNTPQNNFIKVTVLIDRLMAYYLLIVVGSLLLILSQRNAKLKKSVTAR